MCAVAAEIKEEKKVEGKQLTAPVVHEQDVAKHLPVEIVQPVDIDRVADAFKKFQLFKSRLLTKDDMIQIQGKQFLKKSAWRKWALACGVSDELLSIVRIPGEGYDKNNGFHYRVVVKTLHKPTDRSSIGIAAASSSEKKNWAHEEHDVLTLAHCVPLDAQILTRHGWKYATQLTIGEDVLAYSITEDMCLWTPLRNVTIYPELPMIRFHNDKTFDAICSADHSWAMEYRTRHLKYRTLRKASKITYSRLITAAKAKSGTGQISPREAAIIGWLLTDGTIRRNWVTKTKVKGKMYTGNWGPYLRLHIDQSKPKYVRELRELLGEDAYESIMPIQARTFPQGHTSLCLEAYRFGLKSTFANALFEKAGITDIVNLSEIPLLVSNLSSEARSAMLTAMLHADGSVRPRRIDFGVRDQNIMDIFEMLATLEGFALGRPVDNGQGLKRRSLKKARYVASHRLKKDPWGACPAWCPTTDYGTWVMRWHGQITITGNTRAKNRAIADLIGGGEVSAEEILSDVSSQGGGEEGTHEPKPASEPEPTFPQAANLSDVELVKNGRVLAFRRIRQGEVFFEPAFSVKADLSVFRNFLVPRILDALCKKHGGAHGIDVNENGDVLRISVRGINLTEQQLRDLTGAVKWTLERA